jgi:hypothetical protein
MKTTAACLGILLLASASYAQADDAEHWAMAHLRLTTEPAVAQGCARIGAVSDDSLKDLRQKIVRAGGNTGLLSFRADHLSAIHAEVFRCPAARTAPSTAPPGVPPPPPGPPPPPPPGPTH